MKIVKLICFFQKLYVLSVFCSNDDADESQAELRKEINLLVKQAGEIHVKATDMLIHEEKDMLT